MARLQPEDGIDLHRLVTIHGDQVTVPDRVRLVHLQFRRYAGCPVCNLHLRSIAGRIDEITAAGIIEVAVFHSTATTMLEHQGGLPFAVIADPSKILYREFGVETMSPLAGLDPRTWWNAGRAIAAAPSLHGIAGRGEGHLGLPADFLIAPGGRVVTAKYGSRPDDHWTVDDLLTCECFPGWPVAGWQDRFWL